MSPIVKIYLWLLAGPYYWCWSVKKACRCWRDDLRWWWADVKRTARDFMVALNPWIHPRLP